MKLLSSAKINLNLKILGVTQDNLHELISDIIPIGIFDEIEILETNLLDELEQNYYSLLSLRGTLNSVIEVSDSITSNWEKNIVR